MPIQVIHRWSSTVEHDCRVVHGSGAVSRSSVVASKPVHKIKFFEKIKHKGLLAEVGK